MAGRGKEVEDLMLDVVVVPVMPVSLVSLVFPLTISLLVIVLLGASVAVIKTVHGVVVQSHAQLE